MVYKAIRTILYFLFGIFISAAALRADPDPKDNTALSPQELYDLFLRPLPKFWGAQTLFDLARRNSDVRHYLHLTIMKDKRLRQAAMMGRDAFQYFYFLYKRDFPVTDGSFDMAQDPLAYAVKSLEAFLKARREDFSLHKVPPHIAEMRARNEALTRFGYQSSDSSNLGLRSDENLRRYEYRKSSWYADEEEKRRDKSNILIDEWRRFILSRILELRIRNIRSALELVNRHRGQRFESSENPEQELETGFELPQSFDPLALTDPSDPNQTLRPLVFEKPPPSASRSEKLFQFLQNLKHFPRVYFLGNSPASPVSLYWSYRSAHPTWFQPLREAMQTGYETKPLPAVQLDGKVFSLKIDPSVWNPTYSTTTSDPEKTLAVDAYIRDAIKRDHALYEAYEKIRTLNSQDPNVYLKNLKEASDASLRTKTSVRASERLKPNLTPDGLDSLEWHGLLKEPSYWISRDHDAQVRLEQPIVHKVDHKKTWIRRFKDVYLNQLYKLKPRLRPATHITAIILGVLISLKAGIFGLTQSSEFVISTAIPWVKSFSTEGTSIASVSSYEAHNIDSLSDGNLGAPTNSGETEEQSLANKASAKEIFKIYTNNPRVEIPRYFNFMPRRHGSIDQVGPYITPVPTEEWQEWTPPPPPQEALTMSSQIPIIFKNGEYSLPVPEGFQLAHIKVFEVSDNRQEREIYIAKPVLYGIQVLESPDKSFILLRALKEGELDTFPQITRIVAEFSKIEQGLNFWRFDSKIPIDNVLPIVTHLRDAGFTAIADGIELEFETSGQVEFWKIEKMIRELSRYSHAKESKTYKGKPENPFHSLSKFTKKGIAHFECDGSNELLIRIIKESLKGMPQPARLWIGPLVSLVADQSIKTGPAHMRTLVYLGPPSNKFVLDATPTHHDTHSEEEGKKVSNKLKALKLEKERQRQAELLAKQRENSPDSPPNDRLQSQKLISTQPGKRKTLKEILEEQGSDFDNEESAEPKTAPKDQPIFTPPSHWKEIASKLNQSRSLLINNPGFKKLPKSFLRDDSQPFARVLKISKIFEDLANGTLALSEAVHKLQTAYSQLQLFSDSHESMETASEKIIAYELAKISDAQGRIAKGEFKDYKFLSDEILMHPLKSIWKIVGEANWSIPCSTLIEQLAREA